MKLAGRVRPAYFLYQLLWQAADWVFPPECAGGCGRVGVRWCEACQAQVHLVTGPICPYCGDPRPDPTPCKDCSDLLPSYKAMRSYGIFEGTLREALHRLKYQRDIGLGEPLSKHLVELYNQLKWDIDIVVPIPLGIKRLKERGYNQSAMLARPFSFAMNKPYRPAALQRNRETRSQVGLSAQERRANVENSFLASREEVEGKIVLIIDDVTTTGSTLNACAQALREAGASVVYGLTLARAALKNHTDDLPNPTNSKRR